MEQRKTVEEKIYIQILPGNDYKEEVTGSDFKKVEGILDTDRVIGFEWKTWQDRQFMSMDDEEKTFYAPCVTVLRKRPETDDEYFKRMKEETQHKKNIDERERLEYLRLKAKFENEELETENHS